MDEVNGRVLLADDERSFGLTTSEVLRRNGLECDWVASADEARHQMNEHRYDVLVADIKMPGNDQLDLFQTLSDDENAPAVILVTGYPSVDTAVRSLDLGAYAYMVKPFDMQEFVGKVDQARRQVGLRRKLVQHSSIMADLQGRIAALREEVSGNPQRSLDQTACDYLKLLLLSTGETAMEAADLICLMGGEGEQTPVRRLTSHPEVESLRNAVEETVEVLERTKHSFKSKELGSLRQRLNRLLEMTT